MTLPPIEPSDGGGVVGRGVPPLVMHEKTYDRQVRQLVLNPLFAQIRERLRQAGLSYEEIKLAISEVRMEIEDEASKVARRNLRQIEASHKRRFARTMSRRMGVNVLAVLLSQNVAPAMQEALENNVALITSLPERLKASLLLDISKLEAERPFDQKVLSDTLRSRYQKSGYPLRRITRDQTSKLIGDLNRIRQTNVGVRRYVWSTAGDERVRRTHQLNDAKRFTWNNPPPRTGHPGQDIQCRCVALPIFEP